MSHTHDVPLDQATGEVYAVRADYRGPVALDLAKIPAEIECLLTPLATTTSVPAQWQFYLNRGWWYGIVGWGEGRQFGRTVAVRLYRPGYHTVLIHPKGGIHHLGQGATPSTGEVVQQPSSPDGVWWVRAKDVREQHQAVLELLDHTCGSRLAPGSVGREHRRVLLFAVSELERLAAECHVAGADPSQRGSLLADATRLRELADAPLPYPTAEGDSPGSPSRGADPP